MNAKIELLNRLKDVPYKVKCAKIQTKGKWGNDVRIYSLKCNYTSEGWDKFLNSLDFNYNNGYGGQELYGTVWFENGTWLSRGEYDGSEWWELNETPGIPEELS